MFNFEFKYHVPLKPVPIDIESIVKPRVDGINKNDENLKKVEFDRQRKEDCIVTTNPYLEIIDVISKIRDKRGIEMVNKIKEIQILTDKGEIKAINKYLNKPDIYEMYRKFAEEFRKYDWHLVITKNKNGLFDQKNKKFYPIHSTHLELDGTNNYSVVKEILEKKSILNQYKLKWEIPTYDEVVEMSNKNNVSELYENKRIKKSTSDRMMQYCEISWKVAKRSRTAKQVYMVQGNGMMTTERGAGSLVPIYRLGRKDNNIGYLFKVFLEHGWLIEKLNPSQKLFFDVSTMITKYIPFIQSFQEKESGLEIVWDIEKIVDELIIKNSDVFDDIWLDIIYESGKKERCSYKRGIQSGSTTILYKNGDREEAIYVNGVLEGKAFYFCKNGDKKEFKYQNGQKEGKVKIIYSTGDVETAEYKDNKLSGKSIYYYGDGRIEEREYHDGHLEGEAVVRNEDGTILSYYLYKKDQKKDITKLFSLLNVDYLRVNLDPYDENMVTDPNRGHWELFGQSDVGEIEQSLGQKVYGRDPRLDIKKGGIVGIDFGTKSTVVVFQDGKNITLPMRISGTRLNKEIEDTDYENPTVIEFKNINKFLEDYKSCIGRPKTSWEDVTVSHTAAQSLVTGSSRDFYSILSDLKQWAGSKQEQMVVRDKKNTEVLFPPYLELTEENIDPIEWYAYYIGNYVNNPVNGIYLEYFLSFPVTYEKAIREKILSSFEKGIKKSLPTTIVEDEETMKRFRVRHGANEPAAYAVCALQEYGFEPEDDEKVYYGVFDFGGGTLDFDFGIWRASEDERSYDYELEHFGAGGNRYLGGENILKEMAFEVFKDNLDKMRTNHLSFSRPEWCDRFLGEEHIVDNSQESKLNIRILMEKLRGLWENNEEIDERVKLSLFDKRGNQQVGIELEVDKEKLQQMIRTKIQGGIDSFFVAMERAFCNEEYSIAYILLAGNSCKHPAVQQIFEEKIKELEQNIEILPALGSIEANKKLEERGISYPEQDKTKPTGKTGVAYGIVSSRSGGRVKIINRDESVNVGNEINFAFYIGYEGRKKFKPVLTPTTGYFNFIYYLNTTADVFDLYYTTFPEAIDGKMPIERAKKMRINLNEVYEDGEKIYIQSISADTIEYVVTKDDITYKNYLEQGQIVLS